MGSTTSAADSLQDSIGNLHHLAIFCEPSHCWLLTAIGDAFRLQLPRRILTGECGDSGTLRSKERGCCALGGESKYSPPTASGGVGTRHPGTGAAQQLAVAVRELVETRAAKRKIPSRRLL